MAMRRTPRYSVKKYMFIIVVSATLGLVMSAILLGLVGVHSQGILVTVLLVIPVILYSCLRGFHKGLVDHYGFKEPDLDHNRESEQ